jgi:hypothetical protein
MRARIFRLEMERKRAEANQSRRGGKTGPYSLIAGEKTNGYRAGDKSRERVRAKRNSSLIQVCLETEVYHETVAGQGFSPMPYSSIFL